MEYVIGFWLIGVVFTSLFIVARMLQAGKIDLVNLGKTQTIILSLATCLVWPIFVGYAIYTNWRDIEIL